MERNRENVRKLMIAVNRIDGLYYLVSRHAGAKYNTFTLMYALSDGEKHSQKQICDDWFIPRTTLNTIVKECAEKGYLTLTAMKNKEKEIVLTEAGKAYAESLLSEIMDAEMTAMEKTDEVCSDKFVADFEFFTEQLQKSFAPLIENGKGE